MSSDPHHPLLLACRALGAAFDAHDAAIAAGLAVSRNELRLLTALEDGPRSQVDVAASLGVTRAAVTPMVDRLTGRGMVERRTDPGDRRANLVSLTPGVWAALAEHYGPAGRRVLTLIDGLPPARIEDLTAQLLRLVEALRPRGGPSGPEAPQR